MIKRLFLLVVLYSFTLPCISLAQEFVKVPTSPEAAALIKQTDYPVDMSRGLVNISIPLFEVKIGNLTLPVTLGYHAGGFRKDERSTRTGLGWNLSTDIQVSRVINDKDDFSGHGYLNNSLVKGEPNDYFNPNGSATNANAYLMDSIADGSPDKFSFSLLGKSGTFLAKKNATGTGYEFVAIPYDNIKITYADGAFTIVDTDGTIYTFGRTNAEVGQLEATHQSFASHLLEATDWKTTTWKCYRISSAAGANNITFEYEQKDVEYYGTAEDEIIVYKNESPHSTAITWYEGNNTAIFAPSDWQMTLMDKPYKIGHLKKPVIEERLGGITDRVSYKIPYYNSSTGQIQFQQKMSQSETAFRSAQILGLSLKRIVTRTEVVELTGAKKLTGIWHRTHSGHTIRSVDLFYTDLVENNNSHIVNTLYLDSLHVYKENIALKQRYALNYYSKNVFGYQLKGSDMWGFINDYTFNSIMASQTNLTTIPYQQLLVGTYYNISTPTVLTTNKTFSIGRPSPTLRHTFHPSRSGMLKGMLKNIIYPSGQYTEFDYEPHQYRETLTNGTVSQSVAVEAGGLRIRTVNHGDMDGFKLLKQEFYVYGQHEDGAGIGMIRPPRAPELRYYNFVGVRSDPTYQIYYKRTRGSGGAVFSEFITMDTIYRYRPGNYYNYNMPNGSPVYYTHVTRYENDHGQSKGKTVYEFYSPTAYMPAYSRGIFEMFKLHDFDAAPIKASFEIGLQKSVTQYARDDRPELRFKKTHRKNYVYERYQQAGVIRSVLVRKKYLYRALDSNAPYANQILYTQISGAATPTGIGSVSLSGRFAYTEYNLYTGKMLLKQEEDIAYYGDSDSTVTRHEYNYGSLPFIEPTSIVTHSSEGAEQAVTYSYTFNHSNPVYTAMKNLNIIHSPVEEIRREGGTEVNRKTIDYALHHGATGFYAPTKVWESFAGGTLRMLGQYDLYDTYGNLLQYRGRDSIVNSVVWGYNSTLPVMFATNVPYNAIPFRSNTQIVSPISSAALTSFLMTNHGTVIWPKASEVKYFSYDNGKNLIDEIDGALRKTSYVYDGLGRLSRIKDQAGNIKQSIDYNMYRWTHMAALPSFSRPVMESICWQGWPHWNTYNSIAYGGSVSSMDIEGATSAAHANLLSTGYYNLDYSDSTLVSKGSSEHPLIAIKLYAAYMTAYDYPKYAYLDIVRDGQVVATKKLLFNQMAANPKSFNVVSVPPGNYKLSFRVDPTARHEDGFFTNFSVRTGPNDSGTIVAHHSNYSFNLGNEYEIWVTNF